MEAAGRAAAAVGEASGDGLSATKAVIGDGDSVDGGAELRDGAGMTVTTADGEAGRRRRVDEGAGAGAKVGVRLAWGGSVVRLGRGRGGGGTIGLGELEARLGPAVGLVLGLAAGLALAELVAFDAGDGLGAAACADPSRRAGVSAVAATASSSGRGEAGTSRL